MSPKKKGPPPKPVEQQITELEVQLHTTKKLRNLVQLGRDRSADGLAQARRQVSKDALRTKEAELEEAELDHKALIDEYNVRIDQLNADHQATVAEERARCARTGEHMQREHDELETQLRGCIRELKEERREQHLACEALESELQRKHEEEKAELRRRYAERVHDTDDRYKVKELTRERLQDLRRRREVRWQEEQFNFRISLLLGEFREIRAQYNIVKHQTVHQLKEQVDHLRGVAKQREEKMAEVVEQNKGFAAELRKLQAKADADDRSFQQQVRDYENEMAKMATLRARIRASAKDATRIEAAHQELLQVYNVAKVEKAELDKKYMLALQEMQKVLCLSGPVKMGTGNAASSPIVSPPGMVQMIGEV